MSAAGAKTEFARWREEEEAEVRKGQVTLALEGGPWSLREVLEPPVPVNKQRPVVEGAGAGCSHVGAVCVWSLGQAGGLLEQSHQEQGDGRGRAENGLGKMDRAAPSQLPSFLLTGI